MENGKHLDLANQDSPEQLPALIQYIAANQMDGFDSIEVKNNLGNQNKPAAFHSFNPSARVTNTEVVQSQNGFPQCERMHALSISMPPSPLEAHMQNNERVSFRDDAKVILGNDATKSSAASHDANVKQAKFYSQPLPKGFALDKAAATMNFLNYQGLPSRNPRIDKFKDRRFDSFKTWSGKLERQLSHLQGRQRKTEPEENIRDNPEINTPPVDRYFDALEGPELDTLRASEELLLPEDKKWPFLLRYPISSFGICLGVSSQAILWKTLATSVSTKFLHVSLKANFIFWCISIALVAIVSFIYALKIIFYYEAVRREYYHPIRVNFFFAPWIALLFLAIGIPPSIAQNLHQALWYILMIPIFCLEVKIYGQWMSGGQRRLSKVANPSNHLSIVGNFVGALLGASMGLKEGPIFFFSVGLAHYIVLFVTLYQRLPTNETLPKDLHPVFFLFVAAPSVASMAWAKIQGSFDYGSRVAFFIALFLYFSLAVRVNFFRGFRFSLSWWAYTFPMTGASIATIRYTNEVANIVTKSFAVILCSVAILTVAALLITTIIHAFVLRDLFPNDFAIAISERRPNTISKWYHRRSGSSDTKYSNSDTQCAYLDGKGIEAPGIPPSSTTKEVLMTGGIKINDHSQIVPAP